MKTSRQAILLDLLRGGSTTVMDQWHRGEDG
jgi:hypothetical protein